MIKELKYQEQELVEGLRSNDEQVFGYLYDHYSKALFSVIYQVVKQQEAAEDVLQEVFLKIWQNIGSYDASKGRLYTWMFNIARNHSIDKVRSGSFNFQTKTVSLADNVYESSDGAELKLDDPGLKKVLDGLPAENRKLLSLAYFDGYTHEELSKMLGLPLGTVKTKIRNTIIQLRKILTGEK